MTSASLGFDLRILETFAVLGTELNYRRTAEILVISQPAVSQQIKKLEQQLGFALLERTSSGVRLTEAGATVHAATLRSLRTLREAVAPIRARVAGARSLLRIGHLTSWARDEMPALAALIEQHLPQATVSFESLVFDDLLRGLREQHVDLAIFHVPEVVTLDVEALQLTRVGSTQRFVALPAGHRLAARSEVELAELRDEAWVASTGTYADNFVALCRTHGFEPRTAVTAANTDTMLGMVRQGLGVTVTPTAPSGWEGVAFVPLADQILEIVLAQHRDAISAHATELVPLIRAVFASKAAQTVPGAPR